MDYDFKANVTTILTFFLMPVFASMGIDSVTGNAMIAIAALIVFYLAMYVNERYLSNIFTKQGYSVVNTANQFSCDCEEDAVNQEYDSPIDE